MRNVRSALLAAVVGLSLTTACSYSSSRSWGSAATPNRGSTGKGKPALHHSNGKPAQHHGSNGKPAQKTPAPAATPTPAPAPVPPPAAAEPAVQPPAVPPARVPREDPPTRVPRDDTSTSPAAGKGGLRLGTKSATQPTQPVDGGAAKQPPRGLSVAPAQPDPQAKGIKAAPNR